MKAIVFGGSGFVGSHVADALTAAGHEVVIYDKKRSRYLKGPQAMVTGDILDENLVEKTVKGCDVVYNLAGIADIDEASRKPLEAVRVNILGNSIILESCRKARVKRFVFASSLYVYSKAGSFYRSTKQACELLTENYHEIYGLNYTILRYGSLYGQRASDDNFIQKIVKQALSEGRISRYGDGEEIREYIHVSDAAKGSVDILSDEFANQHVILAGPQQTRVKDLLFMIKEILGNKIDIEFLPPKENHHYEITPYSFTPKLGRKLTGRTCVDLSQGILETIRDLYNELNNMRDYGGILLKSDDRKR